MTISRVASSELAFLCNNGRGTSRKRGEGNSMEWNGMLWFATPLTCQGIRLGYSGFPASSQKYLVSLARSPK